MYVLQNYELFVYSKIGGSSWSYDKNVIETRIQNKWAYLTTQFEVQSSSNKMTASINEAWFILLI